MDTPTTKQTKTSKRSSSAEDKKTTTKPTEKPKTNTMKINLINSKNVKINIKGHCTDKEIKGVCKALSHTPDQTFEVK